MNTFFAWFQSFVFPRFIGLAKDHDNSIYIVSEWAARGDLRRYLYSGESAMENKIDWPQKLLFGLDVINGLSYVHSRGIVHRDVKSENCLLTTSLTVKLCDFGLARLLNESEAAKPSDDSKLEPKKPPKLGNLSKGLRMSTAGSDEWMAPEVTLGQNYDQSADLFSFGITMTEICLRHRPRPRLPEEYFEFPEKEFSAELPSDTPVRQERESL